MSSREEKYRCVVKPTKGHVSQTLAETVVGDIVTVVRYGAFGHDFYRRVTIEKVTATQIVTPDGRFLRKNAGRRRAGEHVGDSSARAFIGDAAEKAVAEIDAKHRRQKSRATFIETVRRNADFTQANVWALRAACDAAEAALRDFGEWMETQGDNT